MTNKLSERLVEQTATSLFTLTWSLLSGLGTKVVDQVKARAALNNYYQSYFRRNGAIKVLGMPEPMPLNQIYTKVKLIPAYMDFADQGIHYYEDEFRKKRGDYGRLETLDAFFVANTYDKLNVLGAPGSGKSTLLKKIGLSILVDDEKIDSSRYVHDCIPVFIELKKFRDGNINLKKHIQDEFEIAEFPQSNDFVNNALKKGKLLLLLDGLDEVPGGNLENVIEQIKDFTDKYPLNRYITSCRTAFYKNFLNGYTDIQVASFDDDQIQNFIKNWFSQEKDITSKTFERFQELLFDQKNIQTLELARTPLLLTFLCLTYDDGQYFPANRSSLYKRAMYILLEKWSAEKRIHNEEVYQGLNADIEVEMLAEIAAHFYEKDKSFFYSDELKDRIKEFLLNTLDLKLPPVSKILEAIEVQQGLLVQRAPDIYSFSHLTIQEYLTAYFYHSPKRTPILIENYIFDTKWREVFLLQAGMPYSDDLILMMVDYLREYCEQNEALKNAIIWVNKLIRTENTEEGVCKRVFFLEFLLKYQRNRALATSSFPQFNRQYAQTVIDLLDHSLTKGIAFLKMLVDKVHQKFSMF
ncbi:NACHT domain-containing protein [Pedobacter sp. UC225_65]|uniref:NACHT domain-containing protein n=1 Tax=Pedobacter sp. UC225_65 TaxID=3350173 RepID=UPI00367348C6